MTGFVFSKSLKNERLAVLLKKEDKVPENILKRGRDHYRIFFNLACISTLSNTQYFVILKFMLRIQQRLSVIYVFHCWVATDFCVVLVQPSADQNYILEQWRYLPCSPTVVAMAAADISEEFIENSRGMKLFTCRWLPTDKEAKALICLCHGYGMECSIFMEDTGVRLAKAGYAVFGIDYEGHGKSDGRRCYIQSFDDIVTDCATFFRSVAEGVDYREKARFLYGESMGGAVALLIHRKQPNYWNGAILVAPMCKIVDELKPHPLVISILKKLVAIIPTWKIVPIQDIVDKGFKDPEKRQKIRANPYFYQGRPRLMTAYEIFMTSLDIEKRLDEVSLPFLIVHGEADKVTDPSVGKLLYASARSIDKTLKLYPDMWHALTYGEPAGHIELVFSDIIAWLGKRSGGVGCPENADVENNTDSTETATNMEAEGERQVSKDKQAGVVE